MSIPPRMTAIAIRQPGPPDVLVPQERDTPTPKQGEVLVKVAAAGVNRPDVLQRRGMYPPPEGASDILGLEADGDTVLVGETTVSFLPNGPEGRPELYGERFLG